MSGWFGPEVSLPSDLGTRLGRVQLNCPGLVSLGTPGRQGMCDEEGARGPKEVRAPGMRCNFNNQYLPTTRPRGRANRRE